MGASPAMLWPGPRAYTYTQHQPGVHPACSPPAPIGPRRVPSSPGDASVISDHTSLSCATCMGVCATSTLLHPLCTPASVSLSLPNEKKATASGVHAPPVSHERKQHAGHLDFKDNDLAIIILSRARQQEQQHLLLLSYLLPKSLLTSSLRPLGIVFRGSVSAVFHHSRRVSRLPLLRSPSPSCFQPRLWNMPSHCDLQGRFVPGLLILVLTIALASAPLSVAAGVRASAPVCPSTCCLARPTAAALHESALKGAILSLRVSQCAERFGRECYGRL